MQSPGKPTLHDTNKLQLLRKRDALMLGIIALAIYISLESSSFDYRLDPAWYLDQRKGQTKWRQLAPIVTDLNGDGSNELIVITKDLTLKVLSAAIPSGRIQEKIYSPVEIASAKLSHFNVVKGRIPVLLKTGYIEAYNPSKRRSQVIVVIREDWTVSCFNVKLESLWEKSLSHKLHEMVADFSNYEISDISVFISSISMNHINSTLSSSGMVVIGASMTKRGSPETQIHVDLGINDTHPGLEMGSKPDPKGDTSLGHYTVYALDGHDGTVLWRHDGSEVRAEQFSRSLPQHAYRLDAAELASQLHHGAGINDWTVFRQSLMAEVPHSWRYREDGSSSVRHFVRRHLGSGAGQQVRKPKLAVSAKDVDKKPKRRGNAIAGLGRFPGVETEPLSEDASLPHHASEHTEHPNVLVAHTHRGIEVLALRNGLPLTSLALAPGRTYADVDGDGVMDTVTVLETLEDASTHGHAFAHEGGDLQPCSLLVLAGLPPHSRLFSSTVCQTRHSMHDPLARGGTRPPTAVSAATPLVLLNTLPPDSRDAKVMDIVVAVSVGFVTCYSGKGKFKWQAYNTPSWKQAHKSAGDTMHVAAVPFDWDAVRVQDTGTHDSRYSQVVVQGDHRLSLISREGDVLTSAEIPKKPITRPVFGDFDGDGIVDVVVLTEDSVLGYRLEMTASARGMLIAVLVLVVLAGVVFIANLRSDVITDSRPGSKQRNIFSTMRSTDEWHID